MANEKNDIIELSDYEHVRLRNEMYFGSRDPNTQTVLSYPEGVPVPLEVTWVPAVFTAFREILDNSLDEIIGHSSGSRIDVTYDEATSTFSIKDDGRGIPFDYSEEHQCHFATLALSRARAGRNFKERGRVAGTNGIGGTGVNFCSSSFKLEIERGGEKFTQTFTESDTELVIGKPVIKSGAKNTGTKITFTLSKKVFKNLQLPEFFIRDRLYEIALTNPVKIYFQGKQIKTKSIEKDLFTGKKPITMEIKETDFNSRFWLVPEFFESGEYNQTLVNRIPAFDGGVHIDAFRRNFFSGLITALERESKKRKLVPNRSDISEGLLLFNVTDMDAPNFNSQSKTRLNNEETAKYVRDMLNNPDFFKNIIKKYPDWINSIYARCEARTMKKDASDAAKDSKKMLREKVPDLTDANGKDRSKCILVLTEGLSAAAGMTAVRTPEIHGCLPLGGKTMNVNGQKIPTVLNNKVLRSIMNSIGLVPGSKAIRSELRYQTIYIAADADYDGYDITTLLVNFFYTYWPELFMDEENPMFNTLLTPFIIAAKGKQKKYWYADDHHLFDPEKYKGWAITRAKGLGSLKKDDWKHSIENPKLLPITHDDELKETLDLIFNKGRADDRKDWMGAHDTEQND